MMCEVLNKKYADHIERNAGYRVVNEYEMNTVDDALLDKRPY